MTKEKKRNRQKNRTALFTMMAALAGLVLTISITMNSSRTSARGTDAIRMSAQSARDAAYTEESPAAPTPAPLEVPAAPQSPENLESPAQNTSGELPEIPELEELRSEIAESSHQSPRSAIKFAQRIAPFMSAGLKNERTASLVFSVLSDCASQEKMSVSMQAFCLTNASRLTERFPSLLNERYAMLWDRTTDEAQRIFNASRQLTQ